MRDLVASGDVPALSQLTGNAGFANVRLNDALGHVAFDFIESRWDRTEFVAFSTLSPSRVLSISTRPFSTRRRLRSMRRSGNTWRADSSRWSADGPDLTLLLSSWRALCPLSV
jgi:hypothetical protein